MLEISSCKGLYLYRFLKQVKLKIKYEIFVRFVGTSASPVKLFRIQLLLEKQWFIAVLFLFLSQPEITHSPYMYVYIYIYLYLDKHIHVHKVVFPVVYEYYSVRFF